MACGSARLTGFISRFIYFYASISFAKCADYGIPIEIKVWDSGRTPLGHMVDITNGFGLKVLAEHNFLNDNNIAFSPYGLMGILVALYEGVDGESSYQIQRGMQLPWNRNVMRIGFRDIHRTLKTYFVPEEGFLAGLALNNENVTFTKSYKKILRFYGFELKNDQIPTLIPMSNDTVSTSTSTERSPPSNATESMLTTIITTESTSTKSTKEETTINADVETLDDIDPRGPTSTSATSSAASNSESTTMRVTENSSVPSTTATEITSTQTSSVMTSPSSTIQMTSITPITIIEVATTTAAAETTTVTTTPIMSPSSLTTTDKLAVSDNLSTREMTSLSTSQSSSEDMVVSSTSPSTTADELPVSDNLSTQETVSLSTSQPTSEDMVVSTTSSSMATDEQSVSENWSTREIMSFSTSQSTSQDIDVSSTMTTTLTTNQEDSSTITEMTMETTEASTTSTTSIDEIQSDSTTSSTLETLERRKRSLLDYGIFAKPPIIDDYLFHRSFEIPPEAANTELNTNKMFLVNGLRNVQVSYMHYDTVLEHAYLPHLEASALRLPLDSDRYYLLVVLPSRGNDAELGRLLARMARESDLSDIYAALRPKRVRAIVPSFTVKGHVTLTTDLQKLGIHDVFEPRQNDFTPMTRQAGVYVRSIEQAVSVAIRKYQSDDHKKNRYATNRNRVVFSATYPFLYFVMDSSIHVALMAGKMVDPLNTRIL